MAEYPKAGISSQVTRLDNISCRQKQALSSSLPELGCPQHAEGQMVTSIGTEDMPCSLPQ